MKQKLIIVSNRLPIKIEREGEKLTYIPSVGGLATGLSSFYKKYNCMWIGWPGIVTEEIEADKEELKTKLIEEFNCYPVFLSQEEVEGFRNEFCNKTVWPLFHYFTQYTTYKAECWDAYKRINNKFCDAIVSIAENNELFWIHDYRKRNPSFDLRTNNGQDFFALPTDDKSRTYPGYESDLVYWSGYI